MPKRPTHRFIATYKGHLAGVVIMATPNCFSNLLGADKKHLEKLISRGACISWSPKNLGSALVMFAVRWMAKNTEFRYFTAYSDTEAWELGTIYQACNFTYLGKESGGRFEYFDPSRPEKGWFSDRNFRKFTSFKQYARELNIEWIADWNSGDKIHWDRIPTDVQQALRSATKNYQRSCKSRKLPPKHKYVHILGKTKNETKKLRWLFKTLNPKLSSVSYPKMRGPSDERPRRIQDQELTKRPPSCWPLAAKKFYSIKEVSEMYGISSWLLYHHIKTDPTFPVLNVGIKKKFVIDPSKLETWLEEKTNKFKQAEHHYPSSDELLEAL